MKLQKSKEKDWWVLTDEKHGVVIRFKEGAFNETQQVTLLEDVDPFKIKLHRVMRIMGEWLYENHSEIV